MQSVDSHLENFRQLGGGAPSAIRDLRASALARFSELGFPSTRLEDWKYTDVAPLARQPFRLAAEFEPTTAARREVRRASLGAGTQGVFLNGRYAAPLSSAAALPKGALVTSLAAALEETPSLVEPHLARYARFEEDGLAALNTAFVRDGAFVYLPRGAVIEEPIHLLFVAFAPHGPTVNHPRNLIIAGENSSATVVEHYVGPEDDVYWTNAVTEIALGPNASVTHAKVQRESERAFHVATVAARQHRDSRFLSRSFSFGGALVRNAIATALDAPGGECVLDGLYLTAGQQHVDHHTSIDHLRPHCTSRELYKGILDGRSTGVFNGKVYVRPGAQKSDAQQMNKNLLLSEAAVVDTKPQLEIFADDVKCSHGATIGRLDEDAIFYLRARGVGEATARQLLIYAFANELIERIGVEPLRAQMEGLLHSRFRGGANAEASA
jgi:Fe-S cluster assembly protein SufD